MTTTTGGYTTASLAAQAAEVELSHFTAAHAVALGLLATDRAKEESLGVVIEVYHLQRLAYRVVMPGAPLESDHWLRRKQRVVDHYGASTLAMRVKYEERGTTFAEATGTAETEFAAYGGGFPIVTTGVGIVGAMYVSGLDQVSDHELIISTLRTLKSTSD